MTREAAPAAEERQRDADRSQGAILAAARDEFAECGLGGARMDRIAERAGVNKRLIYYYFEDKEKLFEAVLEQAYLDIREQERTLHLLDLSPAEALRKRLGHPFEINRPQLRASLHDRLDEDQPILVETKAGRRGGVGWRPRGGA